MSKEYKVLIHCNPNTTDLHYYDELEGPKGKYEYTIEAVNQEQAREKALDKFHNNNAIKVLDDFDITVEIK